MMTFGTILNIIDMIIHIAMLVMITPVIIGLTVVVGMCCFLIWEFPKIMGPNVDPK